MSSRREAEREARIKLIAETALRLFTASSFEEVTMDDIAREADFGKATLYHYFDSKDSLLIYIIKQAMSRLCQQMEELCLPAENPVQALSTYVDLRYQYYDRCFPLLLYGLRRRLEGKEFEQLLSSELSELRDRKSRIICQVFERGIAAGVFIPEDSENLLKVVDSLIRGFLWYNLETQERSTDFTMDKQLIDRVLAGGILVNQV